MFQTEIVMARQKLQIAALNSNAVIDAFSNIARIDVPVTL